MRLSPAAAPGKGSDTSLVLQRLLWRQVAMGIGHALFLVDPAHPGVAALEAWEPEEKTCEPVNC